MGFNISDIKQVITIKIYKVSVSMKKTALFFMTALFILNVFAWNVSADWIRLSDTEYKYHTSNNIECKNGLYKIDSVMYKFDENGICQGKYTGWTKQKKDNSKLRYYSDGRACMGWHKIGKMFYHFDDDSGLFSGEKQCEIMKLSEPCVLYDNNKLFIEFTVSNITNKHVFHSHLFQLEKNINGEWMLLELKDDYAWLSESIGDAPHSSYKLKIDTAKQYGELESGTYRIAYYDLDEAIAYSDKFELE